MNAPHKLFPDKSQGTVYNMGRSGRKNPNTKPKIHLCRFQFALVTPPQAVPETHREIPRQWILSLLVLIHLNGNQLIAVHLAGSNIDPQLLKSSKKVCGLNQLI